MKRFLILAVILALLGACSREPDLLGRWRTSPPASLLFEFRSDRSVLLYQDGNVYRVFNYKIIDSDTMQLFDGMGRLRQVDFEIDGDQLLLKETGSEENNVQIWTRVR